MMVNRCYESQRDCHEATALQSLSKAHINQAIVTIIKGYELLLAIWLTADHHQLW